MSGIHNRFTALLLPLMLSGAITSCGTNQNEVDVAVDLGIPVRKSSMDNILPRISSLLSLNIGSDCYQDQIYLGMRDTISKEILLMKKVPLRSKIAGTGAGVPSIDYTNGESGINAVINYLKNYSELDEALTIPTPRNLQVEVGIFGQFFNPQDHNRDGVCDQNSQLIANIDNTWVNLNSLTTARYHHTSAVLPDGRIFVVGGKTPNGVTGSVEIRDAMSGTWTTSQQSLNKARYQHTMTLTKKGKLVVIGGYGQTSQNLNLNDGVEVYDTKSESPTWTLKPIPNSLNNNYQKAPIGHSATLLPDDRILVVGGNDGVSSTSFTAIFDPEKDGEQAWQTINPISTARESHATLIVGDKVVVIGGEDKTSSENTNSFSIATIGSWAWSTFTINTAYNSLTQFTANVYSNNKIIVIGGKNGTNSTSPLNSVFVIDPIQGTATQRTNISTTISDHMTQVLDGDRILVFGGKSGASTLNTQSYLYDPITTYWHPKTQLNTKRTNSTFHLLENNQIITIGGSDSNAIPIEKVEGFVPFSKAIKSTSLMGSVLIDNTAVTNREVKIDINLLHTNPSSDYSLPNDNQSNRHWFKFSQILTILTSGSTAILNRVHYFEKDSIFLIKVPIRTDLDFTSTPTLPSSPVYIPDMDKLKLIFDVHTLSCLNRFCGKYEAVINTNQLNGNPGQSGTMNITLNLIPSPVNHPGAPSTLSGSLTYSRP